MGVSKEDWPCRALPMHQQCDLGGSLGGFMGHTCQKPLVVHRPATFSEANRIRCESPRGFNHRLNAWSRSDWMTAILGELGEAANVVKKLNRVRDGITGNKETPEQLREKLKAEVADTFIYLDLFAQSEGFDLMQVVIEVFNKKSAEIGYPVVYSENP